MMERRLTKREIKNNHWDVITLVNPKKTTKYDKYDTHHFDTIIN